jgi:hypothetical protein
MAIGLLASGWHALRLCEGRGKVHSNTPLEDSGRATQKHQPQNQIGRNTSLRMDLALARQIPLDFRLAREVVRRFEQASHPEC